MYIKCLKIINSFIKKNTHSRIITNRNELRKLNNIQLYNASCIIKVCLNTRFPKDKHLKEKILDTTKQIIAETKYRYFYDIVDTAYVCMETFNYELICFHVIRGFEVKIIFNKKINVPYWLFYSTHDKDINQKNCSICLTSMMINEDSSIRNNIIVKLLQCIHMFHKECIDKWINVKLKNILTPKCPICRILIH